MDAQVLAGLRALRDSLVADVPLARDRESHVRASARAVAADALLQLATEPGQSRPESGPLPPSRAYPSI